MQKINLKKEIKIAEEIARNAGKIMLYYFDHDQKVEQKNDSSLVTIADKKINTMVIKELKKFFPFDDVIGEEESSGSLGMGRKWFCDPIDGTAAFVYGCPTAMFSLGLVIDGVPVLGVMFDPFLNKLFKGVKGNGSFLNKKRIKVSQKKLKGGVFAGSGSLSLCMTEPFSSFLQSIKSKGTRIFSISGVVYKANLLVLGKIVGHVEPGVNNHDICALEVIVEEAGGRVTALDGSKLSYLKPFKGVVMSNGVTHREILNEVRNHLKK